VSFYVPYRGVKEWSLETYWLVGGFSRGLGTQWWESFSQVSQGDAHRRKSVIHFLNQFFPREILEAKATEPGGLSQVEVGRHTVDTTLTN